MSEQRACRVDAVMLMCEAECEERSCQTNSFAVMKIFLLWWAVMLLANVASDQI